jgi:hypothetical protein
MLPEDQEDMINQLTNIDWTSWEAGTQAAQVVRDFGGNIDVTSEKWIGFIDQIRDSSNAIPDIENLRNSYNSALEASKELETGSIISPEDYNTLVNYNAELEKYFTILSDGTAKLTGDILDF